VKFGAVFPTCDLGNDPVAIRDFAQAAEDLGYAHLLIYDHVLGATHELRTPPLTGPYTERDPFHEPMVLLAYLAGLTSRIELATGVLVLPQRQTALVAKQAAELSILSRDRFRLGVGSGWNPVEYQALGVPFEDRGDRLEAQVALLRRLWSEPLVELIDPFHRVDRASILPRPESPIPIWFGGMGARPLRRAARLGDGFIFGGTHRPIREAAARLREELERSGRADVPFGIETQLGFGLGEGAWQRAVELWGPLGLTHLSVRTMSTGAAWSAEPDPGFTRPGEHVAALEQFIRSLR
jgi:probable F420-dependent oxidoreductase